MITCLGLGGSVQAVRRLHTHLRGCCKLLVGLWPLTWFRKLAPLPDDLQRSPAPPAAGVGQSPPAASPLRLLLREEHFESLRHMGGGVDGGQSIAATD